MSLLKSVGKVLGTAGVAAASLVAPKVAQSLVNNYYSRKNTKQAYERDLAFWNMQNEYNTPENQMARLREAGLNPNLIYGQISSGNASGSVHSGIAQERMDSNPLDDIINTSSKILALRQQNAQNKLLETQNIEALNRVGLQDAQLDRYLYDNDIIFRSGLPSNSSPVWRAIFDAFARYFSDNRGREKRLFEIHNPYLNDYGA